MTAKGFSSSKPKHQVLHTVPTVPGPPEFAKARRLDAENLESARKKFAAMEAAGVIRWSSSPWASPLHMVQKPEGLGDLAAITAGLILKLFQIDTLLKNVADYAEWM